MASNCSFFGIISSICGARSGYVCTSCVRIARCTEDFTFDFEPGEILASSADLDFVNHRGIHSFLNILNIFKFRMGCCEVPNVHVLEDEGQENVPRLREPR